ncbi:MAG: response regulator [Betaproteobacteria bacterium]|nr:response regulator [Betaproteobacteria bacterium]
MRVLLVEDDPMIGESIRKGLRQDGYVVDWVQDGAAADLAVASEPYALVLLDLGLPRKDGIEVLRHIRARRLSMPVVILTARDAIAERVKGLDAGADDYLVKPFDLDELGARIRAVLRRHAGRADPVLSHAGLKLNPATHQVSRNDKPVPVSAREFALLQALLERPGATLSRSQLEERLYGWGEEVSSNSVEVHIHNLRRKLGEGAIRTVRGVGYILGGDGGSAVATAEPDARSRPARPRK